MSKEREEYRQELLALYDTRKEAVLAEIRTIDAQIEALEARRDEFDAELCEIRDKRYMLTLVKEGPNNG